MVYSQKTLQHIIGSSAIIGATIGIGIGIYKCVSKLMSYHSPTAYVEGIKIYKDLCDKREQSYPRPPFDTTTFKGSLDAALFQYIRCLERGGEQCTFFVGVYDRNDKDNKPKTLPLEVEIPASVSDPTSTHSLLIDQVKVDKKISKNCMPKDILTPSREKELDDTEKTA